jgi:hypothetical protein
LWCHCARGRTTRLDLAVYGTTLGSLSGFGASIILAPVKCGRANFQDNVVTMCRAAMRDALRSNLTNSIRQLGGGYLPHVRTPQLTGTHPIACSTLGISIVRSDHVPVGQPRIGASSTSATYRDSVPSLGKTSPTNHDQTACERVPDIAQYCPTQIYRQSQCRHATAVCSQDDLSPNRWSAEFYICNNHETRSPIES